MRNFKTLVAVSGLAMALAACEQDPATEVVVPEPMEETDTATTADVDPMTRDYTLTPEAQERRSSFNVDDFNTEYTEMQDQNMSASGTTGTSGSAGTSGTSGTSDSGQMAGNAGSNASGSMASSGSSGGLRDRSAMTWEFLDRNSDGQLSVAEYAIWAIPVDPNKPKPNDELKPYVTAEQANKAADSFFYFDQDGNTYLSQSEFMNARRGADVG